MVSRRPLGVAGQFSYEVAVEMSDKGGHEGVEVGVTTRPEIQHTTYAVLFRNDAWISSDAGNLWMGGSGDPQAGKWQNTSPNALKTGDLVRLTVEEDGAMTVMVNGVMQAHWSPETQAISSGSSIPLDTPLYALVGMRDPCRGVRGRLLRGTVVDPVHPVLSCNQATEDDTSSEDSLIDSYNEVWPSVASSCSDGAPV
jgi:hypothetical protein